VQILLSKEQEKYDSLLFAMLDCRVRYETIFRTALQWFNNQQRKYSFYSREYIKENIKTSDTIFILGGSTSISSITDFEWGVIRSHDSIGMNWWPLHDFVPTYWYTNIPRNKHHRERFANLMSKSTKEYVDTIFISSDRALKRGMHPKVQNALLKNINNYHYFQYEDPLDPKCVNGELIIKDPKTVYYRGGLTLILDVAIKFGYKKIVMLGVDLIDSVHFYDNYPEMQWQYEEGYSQDVVLKTQEPHGTMGTKNGSKLPMDKYLYAVNDMYFKPNRIELFVGSSKSILAGRIPVYDFSRK